MCSTGGILHRDAACVRVSPTIFYGCRMWSSNTLEVTGDFGLLDEVVPFLDGPTLAAGQEESYFEPKVSAQNGTLFEHCARALDRSLVVGRHGLPLIGTGDWNDGMNRVGSAGNGESVWLGWFLHTILLGICSPCRRTRRTPARRKCGAFMSAHSKRRSNGTGGMANGIDAPTLTMGRRLAPPRILNAASIQSLNPGGSFPVPLSRLVALAPWRLSRNISFVAQRGSSLLFTPPFDHASPDPGYIKGYPPGIRENGGQYTHAAIWSVLAFAALGDGDKAGELFSLLNPINHANTRAGVSRYKVEPYVVAADIYAEPPHVGRGGWTWYTGSAGWMYRAGVEWILGMRLRGTKLHLDPCIPQGWRSFEITLRYHSSRYEIVVENPHGVMRGVSFVEFDGIRLAAGSMDVQLADDGATHRARVVLGPERSPSQN